MNTDFYQGYDLNKGSQKSHGPWMAHAQLLIEAGGYTWATILLEAILKENPHHQQALEKIAQCSIHLANNLYENGKRDLALKIYLAIKDSLRREEIYPVLKNIGNIYTQMKNFDQARKHYEMALHICPASDTLMISLGTLSLQTDHWEEAIEWFRKAVQSNSYNDDAWLGLAIIHNHCGDLDLAWANLEKTLDINPLHELALHLYFEWGIENQRERIIEEKLQRLTQKNPHRDDLRILLAKIQFCLGHFEEAQNHTDVFLSHNHEHPAAMQLKAWIEKHGDHQNEDYK